MKFVENIQSSNFEAIYFDLSKIVSGHWMFWRYKDEDREDLVQELFLTLWAKKRFLSYLETEMDNQEILREIRNIELVNIATKNARLASPELYRITRRISTIMQNDSQFRRLDSGRKPLRSQVFGLLEWQSKTARCFGEMESQVKNIPIRQRDNRCVGCTGDSSLIISNKELKNLIINIFQGIDSPCSIAEMRKLTVSRLTVFDFFVSSLTKIFDEEIYDIALIDPLTPEQEMLEAEKLKKAELLTTVFLRNLFTTIKTKKKQQKELLIKVLWYCFLKPTKLTQFALAFKIGVSDSTILSYRQRIQTELRRLNIIDIKQARRFERVLINKLR